LFDEIKNVSPHATAFYFNNIYDAITHFAQITGVKAETLSPEKINQIKREEEVLPPQRDFISNDIWTAEQRRRMAIYETMSYSGVLQNFFLLS
jgi:hypothetical protein